ncbi:hypothetical protein [Zavarzinella formosa]|nr:hypothetical protein [Zavarzinella formosa]
MDDIVALPGRAFRYVDAQYGTIGLMVVGLMIVVAVIGIFIWLDRRK